MRTQTHRARGFGYRRLFLEFYLLLLKEERLIFRQTFGGRCRGIDQYNLPVERRF